MKYLKSIIACILIITSSCQEHIRETQDPFLTIKRSKDANFIEFIQVNETLKTTLLNDYNEFSLESIGELNQFSEHLLESHPIYIEEINKSHRLMKETQGKYPSLTKMSPDEYVNILEKAQVLIDSNKSIQMPCSSNNDCDDQFAKDFERIHEEFDNGARLCTYAIVFGGPIGYQTCQS